MGKEVKEVDYSELSPARRWFLLILAGGGSGIIFTPLYLKNIFYDPLMEAIGASNTDLGALIGLFSIMAVILYLPSGLVADRVRQKYLYSIGMIATSVVVFWYATLPSLTWVYVIFVAMALTTILIWWGARLKLVRLAFPEEEYSSKVGISYSVYGLAGMLVGFVNTAIIAAFENDPITAVRVVLIFLGVVILLLGILGWFFIPFFKDEIDKSSKIDVEGMVEAIKNPGVLWGAIGMLFVYAVYQGLTYTTPFMTGVYAAPVTLVAIVSLIRNYGIGLISGPVAGWMAKFMKSPSKALIVISIISVVALAVFLVLPRDASIVTFVAIMVCVAAFFAYGGYSIATSTITEAKVPLRIFGSAAGLYSLIGFLPDTFIHTWFGSILDAQGDAGYPVIFMILIGSAIIAILCMLMVRRYVKKQASGSVFENASSASAEAGKVAKDANQAAASADAGFEKPDR